MKPMTNKGRIHQLSILVSYNIILPRFVLADHIESLPIQDEPEEGIDF